MKNFPFRLSLPCLAILVFSGCTTNTSPELAGGPGTGPFDSAGNYREDWADDPSKWRRPASRQAVPTPNDDLPVIARVEQPPLHSNPLAPQTISHTRASQPQAASTPRETVRRPEPTSTATAAAKPKPKPVAKPKPKPTPKPTRYVVKKGDTLSAIASRHRSTVAGIQKANRIKGTLIRPGQSLVIPTR